MPFDNFFSGKVRQKPWLSKARKVQLETRYKHSSYFWDKNVRILYREPGFTGWRDGEIVHARRHRQRLEQLKNENPTMEFTWTIAD